MIRLFVFVKLCFLLTLTSLAQTTAAARKKNWKQICSRAVSAAVPTPVFHPAEPESKLQPCDSTALYYGFGGTPDWSGALQCAYYQRAHPQPSTGDPFYGPGVLTMLHANGRGAPRNYDLAIRFACENTWAAEAEMELRVGNLDQLRNLHAANPNSICLMTERAG